VNCPEWLLEYAADDKIPLQSPPLILPSGRTFGDLNAAVRGLVQNLCFAQRQQPDAEAYRHCESAQKPDIAVTWANVVYRDSHDLESLTEFVAALIEKRRQEKQARRRPDGFA
jgi:hypothetical protein